MSDAPDTPTTREEILRAKLAAFEVKLAALKAKIAAEAAATDAAA